MTQLRTLVAIGAILLAAGHAVAEEAPYPLWLAAGPVPPVAEIPPVPGMEHIVVHEAVGGEYQFLLGAALAFQDDTLWASWGNSRVDENDGGSVMGGRASLAVE